jgi:hypothetical protein
MRVASQPDKAVDSCIESAALNAASNSGRQTVIRSARMALSRYGLKMPLLFQSLVEAMDNQ